MALERTSDSLDAQRPTLYFLFLLLIKSIFYFWFIFRFLGTFTYMALRCSRVSRCMRSVSIPHQGSARDPRCWTVSRLLRDHRVGNHLAMGTRAHPQECRTYRGLRLNELRNCGVNDFPDNAPRSATIGSIRGFSLSTCFSVRQCGYGRGESDQPCLSECMAAVIRAQRGCLTARTSHRWFNVQLAARIHTSTTTRFTDVELKADHNQPATSTNCTTCMYCI